MQWLSRMNDAIEYIETNINERVDYAHAATIACCSLSRFQSMFLFATDITPSEYVRRRRMALSAQELTNGDTKIIDLSFKYGYESPEAFARSFKAFHGISPSAARKYGQYIDYPRISFQIQITGGHFSMDTKTRMEEYKDVLVKMEIAELPETLKLAGVTGENLPNFQNINAYHDKYKPLMADRHTPYTEIGISSNLSRGGFYTFGCLVDSIDGLPEGLVGLDTGLKRFACLTFRVLPGGDLLGGADGPGDGMITASDYLKNEWVPKNKDLIYNYQPDHCFEIRKEEKDYRITNMMTDGLEEKYRLFYWIEVYKNSDMQSEPEMCYYVPLK